MTFDDKCNGLAVTFIRCVQLVLANTLKEILHQSSSNLWQQHSETVAKLENTSKRQAAHYPCTGVNPLPKQFWRKLGKQSEVTNSDRLIMIDNFVVTESSLLGKSSALITVEASQVEILEQLTQEEQRDRQRLELGVEQAFYQAGKALAELRDRRLYRTTHKTFEAYCQDRFGFTRRHSDYLISGAEVVENLLSIRAISPPNYERGNLRTIHSQILPTKLEQVKPLTSLKPDQWRLAWNKAVEKANGKVPSGRIVRGVVEQLQAKPLVLASDYCQAGDVFILTRLKGKDSQYNGCWAIALKQTNLTVIVDVHDATLTVKPDNLDKIDSLDVRQQLPQILQRIRRLRQVEKIDRAANNILKTLGKHTELTDVEKDLLSWLENYYRVDQQETNLQ